MQAIIDPTPVRMCSFPSAKKASTWKKAISPSRRCRGFADEGRQDARRVGKVNTIHNHARPYIDRPLATNNLVGGEDASMDAGYFHPEIFACAEELVRASTAANLSGRFSG